MTENIVGFTVGEMKITGFNFVINPDHEPGVFDYLMIKVIDKGIERKCLCQVIDISAYSPTANDEIPIQALQRLIKSATHTIPHLIASAKMIGYKEGKDIIAPKNVPRPAKEIYEATDEFLGTFFSISENVGLNIGNLLNRENFRAQLDVTKFNRHVAILGVTGCGKSNLTGVILEELLERGGTTVVLDPHGDYTSMAQLKTGDIYKLAHRIQVFSRTGTKITVKIADFPIQDLCALAGITKNMTNIMEAVRLTITRLKEDIGNDYSYSIDDLLAELKAVSTDDSVQKKYRNAAPSASVRIRSLKAYDILGTTNTPLEDILDSQKIAIIDLSGIPDYALQMISALLLDRIYNARLRYIRNIKGENFRRPVFIFLEEAQKFSPSGQTAKSSAILQKIASEGRKFGVFIVLATQRPNKVDENVLSMCNSQVIMRTINTKDQKTIQDTSESMAADIMKDLPGLNVGEAVIVGSIVPAPMTVKIRLRKTVHEGADIDIQKELNEALEESGKTKAKELVDDLEGLI